MKRRGFLGLLGGAAVAGPKLAVDLGAQVAGSGLGSSIPSYASGYGEKPASDGGSWKLSRIAELKKLLSGVKDPETENRRRMQRLYQVEHVERFRLDSLRSVSATHKMSMLIDGNLDRQERMDRLHQERELSDLLKTPFG